MSLGFISALFLITISELGDKTFFIAMILATRLPRVWVFSGVITALALMTLISALLGQVLVWLPQHFIDLAVLLLFWGFAAKLLYQAYGMDPSAACSEWEGAASTVTGSPALPLFSWGSLPVRTACQAFGLTFLGEWGDRTQITTIALSSAYPLWTTVLGAILGHGICASLAVLSGRWLAYSLSERMLTWIAGGLFLLLGGWQLWQMMDS
ncbi:MAG: TMEM165/GDT1 family protein [Cyanobacteriota bacterium]|nr:TMEM165/GDT1 family protein [Cyanobacteriota bacterium]